MVQGVTRLIMTFSIFFLPNKLNMEIEMRKRFVTNALKKFNIKKRAIFVIILLKKNVKDLRNK